MFYFCLFFMIKVNWFIALKHLDKNGQRKNLYKKL